MKISLPTSLTGWANILVTDVAKVKYQLVSAIPQSETEAVIPSHFRCTKGHGNRVTHAKPISVWTDLASKISFSGKNKDYILLVNEGEVITQRRSDPTTNSRGSQVHAGYRLLADGKRVQWANSMSWSKSGANYSWSLSFTTQAVTSVKIVGSRVQYVTTSYSRAESGRGFLPTMVWGPSYEGSSRDITSTVNQFKVTVEYQLDSLPLAHLAFRLNELSHVWQGSPLREVARDAMTLAFQHAFDQVPQYADNNIANMIEIGQLFIDVLRPNDIPSLQRLIGKAIDTPKHLADTISSLWLGYRYAYSTTKSDTRQALDTISRKAVTYYNSTRFNGVAHVHDVVVDGDVECRVGFDLTLNAANMLGMLHHYAQLRGVNLSAYKLWDLIPFSFIFDWFCDVGGYLQGQEQLHSYADYNFGNFWWSLKYDTRINDGIVKYSVYSRWDEYFVPDRVVTEYNRASGKTWLKRLGDSVALTISAL